MQNLDDDPELRQWAIWSAIALPLGAGVALYAGARLLAMEAPWAQGGALWLALIVGVFFVGMAGLSLWTWLFARPLTPEEARLRDAMRAWRRERDRFTGGGG